MPPDTAVIILTGGSGERLGGADKATLPLRDSTPLQMILAALPDDIALVISGPPLELTREVAFRQEEPAGGGPVAGIAAALEEVRAPMVGVIAVDMPWAVPALLSCLEQLRDAPDVDAVVPRDRDGRRQPLCCAWRTSQLRSLLPPNPRGASVRDLMAQATIRELTPRADSLLDDIDTPEDLARALRRTDP